MRDTVLRYTTGDNAKPWTERGYKADPTTGAMVDDASSRDAACATVAQDHGAGIERAASHQQQIEARKPRLKQALAAAEQVRRHHQTILVDQIQRDQTLC
jgi:hypothetical protein